MIKVIEKASNISMKRKIFWTVFSSFLLVLIAALTIALVIMHNSYVSNEKTRLQQFTQNAAAEVNHLGLSFLAHNLIAVIIDFALNRTVLRTYCQRRACFFGGLRQTAVDFGNGLCPTGNGID